MPNVLKLLVDVDVKGGEKLSTFGGKLQNVGLGLTKYVTAPIVGLGAASIAMAADAEKSSAKLNAAFKNMGRTSGRTLEQLQDQAAELGTATIFDDEQFMEAQAVLLSFGEVSGEAFDRAIKASADWAAATGKDLPSATQALSRALADPEAALGRLARMGVIFTDSQKEQIAALVESGDKVGAQNLILAEFEERYAGVNEQLQSTAAGSAAQAMEDLANAGEEIGAIFLPAIAQAAQFVAGLARAFTALDPGLQTFIVAVAGVAAAIGPVVFVVGKLVSAFKGVIVVFNLLKIAMLTNPFTLLAVAVAAIAALIILNWDKIWAFLKKTWEAIQKALGGLADFFAKTWQGIVDATTGTFSTIVNIIRGVINGVIDVINGLFGFLNGIQIGIPEVNIGPVHVGGGVLDPFNIPLIPHLAEGGIVDTATLALIGERGPEAVVPLERLGEFDRPNVTIPVQVMGDLHSNTPEELASEIGRVIRLNEALAWD